MEQPADTQTGDGAIWKKYNSKDADSYPNDPDSLFEQACHTAPDCRSGASPHERVAETDGARKDGAGGGDDHGNAIRRNAAPGFASTEFAAFKEFAQYNQFLCLRSDPDFMKQFGPFLAWFQSRQSSADTSRSGHASRPARAAATATATIAKGSAPSGRFQAVPFYHPAPGTPYVPTLYPREPTIYTGKKVDLPDFTTACEREFRLCKPFFTTEEEKVLWASRRIARGVIDLHDGESWPSFRDRLGGGSGEKTDGQPGSPIQPQPTSTPVAIDKEDDTTVAAIITNPDPERPPKRQRCDTDCEVLPSSAIPQDDARQLEERRRAEKLRQELLERKNRAVRTNTLSVAGSINSSVVDVPVRKQLSESMTDVEMGGVAIDGSQIGDQAGIDAVAPDEPDPSVVKLSAIAVDPTGMPLTPPNQSRDKDVEDGEVDSSPERLSLTSSGVANHAQDSEMSNRPPSLVVKTETKDVDEDETEDGIDSDWNTRKPTSLVDEGRSKDEDEKASLLASLLATVDEVAASQPPSSSSDAFFRARQELDQRLESRAYQLDERERPQEGDLMDDLRVKVQQWEDNTGGRSDMLAEFGFGILDPRPLLEEAGVAFGTGRRGYVRGRGRGRGRARGRVKRG